MLQPLLVFIAIGVAVGVVLPQSSCPIFSVLENDVSLFSKLNGTFYKIYANGISPVANCQKQTFTIGPNNTIDGYFQSPNWCLHLNNCDTSNSEYYQCDLTPITPGVAALPTAQRNSIKLVGEIEIDDSFCLIYTYCRPTEEGSYVLCRQPPKLIFTLFLAVFELLTRLLNSVLSVPFLTLVNHYNCNFPNSCPP